MNPIRVGLLGLGTVGRGTWNVLRRNQPEIQRRAGRGIEVARIAVRNVAQARAFVGADCPVTTEPLDVVRHPEVDINCLACLSSAATLMIFNPQKERMMKHIKVVFGVLLIVSVLLAACAPAATPAPVVQTVVVTKEVPKEVVVTKEVEKQVVVTPTPGPNPEAVIQGVEPNAEVALWTSWLSPTFAQYIKDTIARFEATYPGVKVKWEDHQATFQDDLRNAFAAGNAPDVINLSVGEGWVSDYATKGLLLGLDDKVPQNVKDLYFPGLWKEQLVDGVNYQFPWYQGIGVELVNTKIYSEAGLKLEDFPKTVDGLPALCKTIKEKTARGRPDAECVKARAPSHAGDSDCTNRTPACAVSACCAPTLGCEVRGVASAAG